MPLYEDFADVYDAIFTKKDTTATFLNNNLKKRNVLDLACGTGTYAICLAENGYHVVGTDLDASMIAKAKTKRHQPNNPEFYVENMLDLSALNFYDGIYSIGNSIVHLENERTIQLLFEKVLKALKNNGVFILQIINYARILDQNIDHLPTIKNGDLVFERNYVYQPPYIHFNTILTKENNPTYNTVRLYPIRPSTVLSILQTVGFKEIKTYGSFNETTFDEESSLPFIVVAEKHM